MPAHALPLELHLHTVQDYCRAPFTASISGRLSLKASLDMSSSHPTAGLDRALSSSSVLVTLLRIVLYSKYMHHPLNDAVDVSC